MDLGYRINPGDMVADRFRVERVLGEGGFGVVFEATQVNLGRKVALKVLRPSLVEDKTRAERFLREARLAQRLSHPNTVRLYDFGATDDGLLFIAWEYLDGVPLDEVIPAQSPIAPERVARIAAQILKSLMEAHKAGVVHRDIKPANIVLCDFMREPDYVKVLDFGIAKDVGTEGERASETLTRAGALIGTPPYMAPEQVGAEPVGPAADLYALGLVMAEMLTGERVFNHGNSLQICMQQASPRPVPLSEGVKSSALGAVIERATAKPTAERYSSAEEMLDALMEAAKPQGEGLRTLGMVSPVAIKKTVLSPAVEAKPEGTRWWLIAMVVLAIVMALGCLGLIAVGMSLTGAGPFASGAEAEQSAAPPEPEATRTRRERESGAAEKKRKRPRPFDKWKAKDLRKRLAAIGCRVDDFSSMDIAGARSDSFSALCGETIYTLTLYRSASAVARGSMILASAEDGASEEDGDVIITVYGEDKADSQRLLERLLY